jgi:hypothetical protein
MQAAPFLPTTKPSCRASKCGLRTSDSSTARPRKEAPSPTPAPCWQAPAASQRPPPATVQSRGFQAGGLALAQVEFLNCDFFNNRAGNGGGAALVEGAFGLFENCAFMDNSASEPRQRRVQRRGRSLATCSQLPAAAAAHATGRPRAAGPDLGGGTGGGLLVSYQAGFKNCTFARNSADNGGAVGVGGSSSGIFFDGCTFEVRSVGREWGGGVGVGWGGRAGGRGMACQGAHARAAGRPSPAALRRTTPRAPLARMCTWRVGSRRSRILTPSPPRQTSTAPSLPSPCAKIPASLSLGPGTHPFVPFSGTARRYCPPPLAGACLLCLDSFL